MSLLQCSVKTDRPHLLPAVPGGNTDSETLGRPPAGGRAGHAAPIMMARRLLMAAGL